MGYIGVSLCIHISITRLLVHICMIHFKIVYHYLKKCTKYLNYFNSTILVQDLANSQMAIEDSSKISRKCDYEDKTYCIYLIILRTMSGK